MNLFKPQVEEVKKSHLIILAVVSVFIVLVLEIIMTTEKQRDLSLAQIETVNRIEEAQRVLYEKRSELVSPDTLEELERADPNKTGLVGIEWSHLVTTPGSHEAKMLSCDPRWGLLICNWLEKAGVEPGSTVAVGSSGSFPGLMVAVRIAAESMGAKPVVVGSLTSSNYGATIPEFDLFEIDRTLFEAGIFENHLSLMTPGGEEDRLYGFAKSDEELILNRLNYITKNSQTEVFIPENLEDSIEQRSAILLEQNNPKVFINIGGNSANYGEGVSALSLPKGYVDVEKSESLTIEGDSVAKRAMNKKIPVINLINLREITLEKAYYFTAATDQAEPVLIEYQWSKLQRFLAVLFAMVLLAGCMLLPKKSKEKTESTGVEKHVSS